MSCSSRSFLHINGSVACTVYVAFKKQNKKGFIALSHKIRSEGSEIVQSTKIQLGGYLIVPLRVIQRICDMQIHCVKFAFTCGQQRVRTRGLTTLNQDLFLHFIRREKESTKHVQYRFSEQLKEVLSIYSAFRLSASALGDKGFQT